MCVKALLLLLLFVVGCVFGKVYERCELARELKNKYGFPLSQLATWVCIVHHESTYNTAAIGRLNSDGSSDHGLFQINDKYWCSPPGNGKGCAVTCAELREDNIGKAVSCVKKVYDETQRLKGDGFTAWSVYDRDCSRGRSKKYTEGCGV